MQGSTKKLHRELRVGLYIANNDFGRDKDTVSFTPLLPQTQQAYRDTRVVAQ
jgi:hypothetical protein